MAFWISTGARASELLGARHCDVDPGQQLITVVRKGSRATQQVPAAADAFVWLRLYQEDLRGKMPRGRTQPLWWTLRRPHRPLTYHAAHRLFERANATLGADWALHDLRTHRHRPTSTPRHRSRTASRRPERETGGPRPRTGSGPSRESGADGQPEQTKLTKPINVQVQSDVPSRSWSTPRGFMAISRCCCRCADSARSCRSTPPVRPKWTLRRNPRSA